MKRTWNCLRCQTQMRYLKREKLQLGQTGWILGDWPNLLAGALEVDIYGCPNCGKLEFFWPQDQEKNGNRIAQVQCPQCGKFHDMDDPKCPFCKYSSYEK